MSLMDDVAYVVKLPEAQMLLEALPAILESRGFRVNLSKTQIYNPDGKPQEHRPWQHIMALDMPRKGLCSWVSLCLVSITTFMLG